MTQANIYTYIYFDVFFTLINYERKTPELRKIALAKGKHTQIQISIHRELCRI